MAKKTLRGKCLGCCPDGGAIFDLEYQPVGGWNAEPLSDKWETVKKCRNCNHSVVLRTINQKPDKPNARQQQVIDRITQAFGGEHEVKMVGRKVWISAQNHDGRKFYEGRSFYGTIGPKGALDLILQRPFGDKRIKDHWDVRTYLITTKKES